MRIWRGTRDKRYPTERTMLLEQLECMEDFCNVYIPDDCDFDPDEEEAYGEENWTKVVARDFSFEESTSRGFLV